MKSSLLRLALIAAVVTGFVACKKSDPHASHDHSAHKHEHVAPHGGTAVVLGDELYHLELVLDATKGLLQVYVLDGELEKFVRITDPAIELTATAGGLTHTLVLKPSTNDATGETVGDTSLYEAQAEWLKTTPVFDAVVKLVSIRGKEFQDVKFNFPKGNEAH